MSGATAAPRDYVILSSIDWSRNWQIHQQLATSLVEAGHRVLFVENTGVRAPRSGDLQRIGVRLQNWLRSTRGFKEVRDDLTVFSPLFIPLPYARWAVALNRRLLSGAIRRWCKASGFRHPGLITFLPTPLAQGLIKDIDPSLTVYYCANDMAGGSEGAARLRPFEATFFAQVDAVFCNAQALLERARQQGGQAHLFPAGVDFEKFEQARQDGDVAAELAAWPRPRVGYVGSISAAFDQALLAEAARAMPHVHFVLVGPISAEVDTLRECANVHLLGPRTHDQIPGFIHGFDVGLIPYVCNAFTDAVYPCKLNEYLAMGIPVVSSNLAEIRAYRERHGDVVALAGDAPAFCAQLSQALIPREDAADAALRQRRIDVARGQGWKQRFADMQQVLEGIALAKRRERLPWQARLLGLYQHGQGRLIKVLAGGLALGALVFYSPLFWWLGQPLVLDQPARAAQAIVVFSGDGDPSANHLGFLRRTDDALRLYQAGLAPRIIVSSGWGKETSEAQAVRALLIERGVPAQAIEVVPGVPSSTLLNVQLTHRYLNQQGVQSVLFLTGPYHQMRATAVWAKQAPDIQLTTVKAEGGPPIDLAWRVPAPVVRLIAYEYLAWLNAWLRGWL